MVPRTGERRASPVARRLAAALGIDLADRVGSGHRGRILKADVRAAWAALRGEQQADASAPTGLPVQLEETIDADRLLALVEAMTARDPSATLAGLVASAVAGLSVEADALELLDLAEGGVAWGAAGILPGGPATLAIGAPRTGPLVRDGAVVLGARLTLTLTSDGRRIDASAAEALLVALRELLENPEKMVL
jgi:pyruvate/2-oxoglutarate dehydrogenase complex dihydrolipoamide acyltransferase (E2) component